MVFDYYDDDSTDDIPNTKEAIASGFTTNNAWYIGNAALNALTFMEAEFCMAKSRMSASISCNAWEVRSKVTSIPSSVGPGYTSCYVLGDDDFDYTPSSTYDTLSELSGRTRQLSNTATLLQPSASRKSCLWKLDLRII